MLKRRSIYTVYSKVLNGQLEYAKFNNSILAASDEAVPQLKLTASEEELQLKSRTRGEKGLPLKQKKKQKNSLWFAKTIVLLSIVNLGFIYRL
jgi:hypothetical protein